MLVGSTWTLPPTSPAPPSLCLRLQSHDGWWWSRCDGPSDKPEQRENTPDRLTGVMLLLVSGRHTHHHPGVALQAVPRQTSARCELRVEPHAPCRLHSQTSPRPFLQPSQPASVDGVGAVTLFDGPATFRLAPLAQRSHPWAFPTNRDLGFALREATRTGPALFSTTSGWTSTPTLRVACSRVACCGRRADIKQDCPHIDAASVACRPSLAC